MFDATRVAGVLCGEGETNDVGYEADEARGKGELSNDVELDVSMPDAIQCDLVVDDGDLG
jgi:hypothetical protein